MMIGQRMTTANKVTIFRILLIPIFVAELLYYQRSGNELHRFGAVLAFGIAAICDGVDGYIARRYNQRSELGAILDPLGDKLLLLSSIIILSLNNPYLRSLPLWLTVTIIGRDLMILIGMGVIHMTVGKVKVRPRILGKVATVLQIVCVAWILLQWDERFSAAWFLFWTISAASCTAGAGLLYVLDGVRQLSSHPASSPTRPPGV